MNVVDLNGRFFMPEPVADLFLRPHVTLVDIAGSSATGWSLDLGYYVMDNMVVTLPGLAYGSFESGADVLEIDLDVIAAEHVHPMGEQNLYLLGSYSFDAERLTLGAVYYLDKSLGIGGEIALYDGGPAITVGASYWLHQGLGVRGSLTFDDGDAELSVGVVARF